ncbi:hypothetical protein PRNP1_014790 [Phytophthora ramorum]
MKRLAVHMWTAQGTREIYSGLGATISRITPYMGLSYGIYSTLNEVSVESRKKQEQDEPDAWMSLSTARSCQNGGDKAAAKDAGAKDKETKARVCGKWWLDSPGRWGSNRRQQGKGGQDDAFEVGTLRKRRSLMNAKAQSKAKKSSEDEGGEMETWWKDSKYRGTDYMDVLAKDEVKPVDGASKTPQSPQVAQHTWAASMTLRK